MAPYKDQVFIIYPSLLDQSHGAWRLTIVQGDGSEQAGLSLASTCHPQRVASTLRHTRLGGCVR